MSFWISDGIQYTLSSIKYHAPMLHIFKLIWKKEKKNKLKHTLNTPNCLQIKMFNVCVSDFRSGFVFFFIICVWIPLDGVCLKTWVTKTANSFMAFYQFPIGKHHFSSDIFLGKIVNIGDFCSNIKIENAANGKVKWTLSPMKLVF